jgi:hypothetical protein
MIWRPWTAVIDDAWRVAVRRNSVFVECCSMVLLACNVMLRVAQTVRFASRLGPRCEAVRHETLTL